ncbi:bifunctional diaminohydroxyphosphoribosylaminopyrimidine deaminase/5-amino-6-(5-phosphoribosylamino)uracil reductase RibD [Pyruvatibacter sp.]|uniref:bifunctional diaminohydroxyphosphoribosylaminopyrimidine deaminase/5-amino-6-(5-phosphoribosylamino)uracil reductase RibD n=1 Tax=Pyruvatibacter sp. TaxID=1981328 RepID=UPI0032EB19E6
MAAGFTQQQTDARFMRAALTLAARGLGQVAPNPSVGCIIVADDAGTPIVVGRGWTQPCGRPHAETEALRRAGNKTRGATVYVTLEPCAHSGKTGPCAQALIEAGAARVVVACGDPDDRVNGKGIQMLRGAGIEVTAGVLEAEARELNAGFMTRVTAQRPLVILKIASTLDGKIATHTGKSHWITGDMARERTHLMRAQADAIMVGSATAIVDDPQLTCRLPGLSHRSPIRVIADGRLRLPLTSKLVQSAREHRLIVLTRGDAERHRHDAFEDLGVELVDVPVGADNRMDMTKALVLLAGLGITRVMVEGGARLAASLLRADLVDRIEWFQAPKIIGDDGYSAVAGLGLDDIDLDAGYEQVAVTPLGEDVLTSLRVRT